MVLRPCGDTLYSPDFRSKLGFIDCKAFMVDYPFIKSEMIVKFSIIQTEVTMFAGLDIEKMIDTYVVPWSINIALAIVVFIVGRLIAKGLVKVLERLLVRAKVDTMLVEFIGSIASAALFLFVIIASLDMLGVNTTSLIAMLGAAGLAVGLALQGSLQNFASGVLLIIFRPFQVGNFIEAGGIAGTVEKITIFNTIMLTPDNREIIVPNGAVYGGTITNISARDTRRVDMVFGIGYGDDIKKAKEILMQAMESDERILKDPAPMVALAELADSSVNFVVRPWVNAADYWAVKFDFTEKIKLAFDEKGVSIPFPQMDIHMDQAA
jgi:small conductance mechanosensitive channel